MGVEIKSSDVVDVVEETVDSSSKSDKKKKKKKEKHKSKDKERDKEKKHKHKHKDKDKEKHKEKDKHKDRQEIDAPRLKISLPQPAVSAPAAVAATTVAAAATVAAEAAAAAEESDSKPVLKLKIPKGRIESDAAPLNGSSPSIPGASQPMSVAGGLKIKISRDMISSSSSSKEKDSRKRTTSSCSSGGSSSNLMRSLPAAKIPKTEPHQSQSLQQQTHQQQQGSQGVLQAPQRNGSNAVEENRIGESRGQRGHPQRSVSGLNKMAMGVAPSPSSITTH